MEYPTLVNTRGDRVIKKCSAKGCRNSVYIPIHKVDNHALFLCKQHGGSWRSIIHKVG